MLYCVLLPGSLHPRWRWRILIGKIYGEFHFTPDDDIETLFDGFTEVEIYIAANRRFNLSSEGGYRESYQSL